MNNVFEDSIQKSHFSLRAFSQYESTPDIHSFAILWCTEGRLEVEVDHQPIHLEAQQLIFLAPNQQLEILQAAKGYIFQYNREFYCLLDHDKEIGCLGLLYYGAAEVPMIQLDPRIQRKFELLVQVFIDEFETVDNIQEDMLRMLLKRLIILCTRLLKEQAPLSYQADELEIIRQFHILLEQHFRTLQRVAAYAELIHKSPKTLANLFATNGELPPLKQIHQRMALEAKRLLLYTDKTIKEIAYELNFEEVTHFSRFFKREVHLSPSEFKKQAFREKSVTPREK